MQHSVFGRCLLPAAVIFLASIAAAGPPLETDDTGILDPGGWEFIFFGQADKRDTLDAYILPGLDVSYGLTENSQVTAAIGRIEVDDPVAGRKSDLDAASFEFKWRLYQGEKTAIAVVPSYGFPVNSSSRDRGIIDDVRVLGLPVVGSFETGKWLFNAQYAYELTSRGSNAGFYGLSAGYAVTESLQLLGEIYGLEVYGQDADEINFNVGLDYGFATGWALLLSVGSGINSNLQRADELDSAVFLGLRYETG